MATKERIGYIEGILSSILNVILFGMKLIVGVSVGSVSMIADAWHTLSDTLTSLIVILGFWFSSQPEDKEHPFGHGRAEPIAGIIIGVLMGLVGFRFISESVVNLRGHAAAVFDSRSIIVFAVSVLLKEAMAQFAIRAGKKVNSSSLIADGWHHRSDAIASAIIVVGAFFSHKIWWIDSVLGIIVSLFILFFTYEVIRHAANQLLGEAASDSEIKELNSLLSETGATNIHHVHIHRYGDHVEMTLHVELPKDTLLEDAHATGTKIEALIRKTLNYEPTVHIEPY